MKNLKKIGALGLATVMTLSSINAVSAADDKKDVETLSVLMYTDWYKAGWQAVEEYINEHADELGFKLEISKIQGGAQGEQVMATKFATGDLPDIISFYSPQWVDANTTGLDKLVDLTGIESVSEYDDELINSRYCLDGKLYAMPIDSAVLSGVFYNKKVFEDAGVEIPKTWDEFLDVCQKLKDYGVTPVYYADKDLWCANGPVLCGLVSDAADKGINTYDLTKQICSNELKFADCEKFIGTVKNAKDLIDEGFVNETYLSDTVDGAHQALADGTCGMFINGTWCADNIAEKFPDKADDIGAFALPTETGENYIIMFPPRSIALTTSCKDVELGKKAIDFLASSTAQQIYADAQPGLYANKDVNSTAPQATLELKEIMDNGMYMVDWEDIMKYAYGDLSEFLVNYYTGLFENPEDVAKAMDDQVEQNAKAAGDENW